MSNTDTVSSSLTQDAKHVYQLFRPYFGFEAKNRWRTAAIIVVLAGCITSSITMVFIQNAFTALNIAILTPGITLSVFGWGIAACLVPILSYAAILSFTALATSWLSDNLSHELGKTFISKWIDKKAFYGIKFISKDSKDTKMNPGVILGDDLTEICTSSTSLASSLTQSFLDFVVGAYQLWILSAPLVVTLFSMTFAIPAYMTLGALGYAAMYGLIVHFIDKNLREIDGKYKKQKDSFNTQLHHVGEHGETIAMKMGNNKEKSNLLHKQQKLSSTVAEKRQVNFFLAFAQNISMNVSYLFGLALSAPGVISGKLDPSNAFSVASYFTSVVNFFSWKKTNTATITGLSVSLGRFNAFQLLMEQWEALQGAKKLTTRKRTNYFGVKKLTFSLPDGKTILKDDTFTIPHGKATVIQGPSGIGKTTLFRCLADLWPFVEGELILPADKKKDQLKIHYIPQQPYFPCRSSLIDAINYPSDEKPTAQKRKKIIQLMKDLEFEQETIDSLDIKDDWGKNRISGGERQRVAIISAIIKNPDILFIDEGTNGLDSRTKELAEKALKNNLKGKTIVAIDHHAEPEKPVTPFYDYSLSMKENKGKGKVAHASITLRPFQARSLQTRSSATYRTR